MSIALTILLDILLVTLVALLVLRVDRLEQKIEQLQPPKYTCVPSESGSWQTQTCRYNR